MDRFYNSIILLFKNYLRSKLIPPEKDQDYSTVPQGFSDNGDGTVTDHTTCLMWRKCCEGNQTIMCMGGSKTFVAEQLSTLINAINQRDGFANYNDWRYPTEDELKSIAQLCLINKFQVVFPNSPTGSYWSEDISSYNKQRYNRLLEFGSERAGCIDFGYQRGKKGYVRLVRDIT